MHKLLIGLHDADKPYLHQTGLHFPNLALMKIAAYHKALGDLVEWFLPLKRDAYDKVYSSKIFDYTKEEDALPWNAEMGGTGYSATSELPHYIDTCKPDYSIYPGCDYAIGFLTRGCIRHCPWCVVPEKEGPLRPYRTWDQIVRPDSKKLVLMDNNILASDHGIRQMEELTKTNYKIDINQGMDIRLLDESIVKHILAKMDWIKYIRFSCDTAEQLPYFEKAVEWFKKYGIAQRKLFVYMLIRDDLQDAEHRVHELQRMSLSINLYAQAERNSRLGIIPTAAQLTFAQRYVYGRCYKNETWKEYCGRHGIDG
jgi:hypothetical protein